MANMTRIEILDVMREVAYSIDYYKNKINDCNQMLNKYRELCITVIVEMYEKRIEAQERLVRILEIRFEKLKKQL